MGMLRDTKLRGVQLASLEDGFLVFVPKPEYLYQGMKRRTMTLLHHVSSVCWPFHPSSILAIVFAFVGVVVQFGPESWWKSGTLTATMWAIDSYMPWEGFLPVRVRAAYLFAIVTSFLALLLITFIQRLLLRAMLSYRGWLTEEHGKVSALTLLWASVMKALFLGGRKPMLYSFQNALPTMHVPELHATVDQFLVSVQPVLSEHEYRRIDAEAERFKEEEGPKLQKVLVLKSWFCSNYVNDWWEEYVYLRSRESLLVNSNYYGLGYAWWVPSSSQISRAAVLVHLFCQFQEQLETQQLAPLYIRNTVPCCMAQYHRVFGTTRTPRRDCDVVQTYPGAESRHIVVLCNGSYFRINTRHDERYGTVRYTGALSGVANKKKRID
jgi:hypothetical protein